MTRATTVPFFLDFPNANTESPPCFPKMYVVVWLMTGLNTLLYPSLPQIVIKSFWSLKKRRILASSLLIRSYKTSETFRIGKSFPAKKSNNLKIRTIIGMNILRLKPRLKARRLSLGSFGSTTSGIVLVI